MRYGCKYGLPHDLKIIHENPQIKWEVCQICNKKFKWNKGYKGRVHNTEYLKVHIRNYCQKGGSTKRVYYKIYRPSDCTIVI